MFGLEEVVVICMTESSQVAAEGSGIAYSKRARECQTDYLLMMISFQCHCRWMILMHFH
jgi:hypothetical protein